MMNDERWMLLRSNFASIRSTSAAKRGRVITDRCEDRRDAIRTQWPHKYLAQDSRRRRHHRANKMSTAGSRIREVWSNNFEQEMAALRGAIDRYPYVAMVSTIYANKCVAN